MSKPDAYGGNGDIFFSDDGKKAKKVLRNTSSREKLIRFKRELEFFQDQSKKKIPNIVEIYDVFIDEDKISKSYVIMKKYDGVLTDLLNYTKGNVVKTLSLLLPVIKALKTLSEGNPKIYHRDLKPANLLYLEKPDGYELYITDFGTCFLSDDIRLTENNIAIGSRMFIAPEYEVGKVENIDEKGDIYSLGKIIWYMLNGEKEELLPSNLWFIDDFNLSKKFKDIDDIFAGNIIIASCLSINPDERPTYSELISMIENILNDENDIEDIKNKYKVMEFEAERKIIRKEKIEKNILLADSFSKLYLESLEILINKYPKFELINKLYDEYKLNYSNSCHKSIMDDWNHYLYSTSFDNLYIAISFIPASNGETYGKIEFRYNINSNGKSKIADIKFNNHNNLIINCNETIKDFTLKAMTQLLNNLIEDYIS